MPATDEKKYYTPSIEEFHVGFEYEVYVDDLEVITEALWLKTTIDSWQFHNLKILSQASDRLRVKHLDQEDIESLGWVRDKELTGNPKRFVIETINGVKRVLMQDNTECLIESYPYDYKFHGHIKNKSELKKLMQQIGII